MAAKLPDIMALINAGIDPATGKPIRMGSNTSKLKDEIRKLIRIQDEQEAINRFVWYNLPSGLTGQLLERILYYRGQGCLFYWADMDEFFFLPYALDGTIDVYGRFTGVKPIPFNGTTDNGNVDKQLKSILDMQKRIPVYSIEEVMRDPKKYTVKDYCVLLRDYTQQQSENIIPRALLQESVIDAMSEAFPMARTNLIANCGIRGLRVSDEDSSEQVYRTNDKIKKAALSGEVNIPFVSGTEFQEVTGASPGRAQDFLLYMQSLDNFRRSCYGLKSGGVFEKKAHELQSEAMVNQSNTDLIYQDGLTIRQNFCDLVNLIFGLGIWCESSEVATGLDTNMDGKTMDEENVVDEVNVAENVGGEVNEY